jgi:hypothetical protein
MTKIINLFPVAPVHTATSDDEVIWRISNSLSGLELTATSTQDEMTRALCTITAANLFIGIVLDDFRDSTNARQLISQTEMLLNLIECARTQVTGLNRTARPSVER